MRRRIVVNNFMIFDATFCEWNRLIGNANQRRAKSIHLTVTGEECRVQFRGAGDLVTATADLAARDGRRIIEMIVNQANIGTFDDREKNPSARYESAADETGRKSVWSIAHRNERERSDLILKRVYPAAFESLSDLGLNGSQQSFLGKQIETGSGTILFIGIDDLAQAHAAVRLTLNLLPAAQAADVSCVAENFYQSYPSRVCHRVRHERQFAYLNENHFETRVIAVEEMLMVSGREFSVLRGLAAKGHLLICQTQIILLSYVLRHLGEEFTAAELTEIFRLFIFVEQEKQVCPDCLPADEIRGDRIECETCFDLGSRFVVKPAQMLPMNSPLAQIMTDRKADWSKFRETAAKNNLFFD